ncbi:phosphodiesterase/alkaline phosphatase D-like protein [Amycolatopsis umgeniensis]|uniref:Phosphodiesterase/alkaline phosphatase D-like protein n=1 Tax=Amycolatopsis umgeniensis TaxID=336628 RepID=A0A841BB69_9PSEU|nr:phosphodiesterase/alkaline phosphatase D-like protein [Amycolatopsis umgeniensis]
MTASHHNRRTLLKAGLTGAGAVAGGLLLPGTATAAPGAVPLLRRDRPVLTHGVQSGDVTTGSGIVWSRADRPSRLIVEVSRDPSFRHARRVRGPVMSPETGGTGKVRVAGLPPGPRSTTA